MSTTHKAIKLPNPYTKKILLALFLFTTTYLGYWFFLKKENPQNYIDYISLHRYERAEFFRYSPKSPFLTQKVNFTYIDYYPTNIELRIEANFERSNKLDTIALATSTGTIDKYIIVGKAHFQFQEKNNTLLVLESLSQHDKTLFIPYLDKTSGDATYGGGRYLDVNTPNGKTILLDFNKSYNPYCAYTDAYTCPFPPKENRLAIAIEAGEKSFSAY